MHASVRAFSNILAAHNQIEKGAEGLYARCEQALGQSGDDVYRRLRAVAAVRPAPYYDGPTALPAAARALERAGFGDLTQRLLAPGTE